MADPNEQIEKELQSKSFASVVPPEESPRQVKKIPSTVPKQKAPIQLKTPKAIAKPAPPPAPTEPKSTSLIPRRNQQSSVVSRDTPYPRSGTEEPTYPSDDAVEFENPAYHTIGPDFDDPFKGLGGPKPPLATAKLVESR